MIGIRFKIKNEYDNIFYKIFKGINLDECDWNIVEDEIYSQTGENYFDKDYYSNNEFQELIKYGTYYPVFANIQIYIKQEKLEDIETYQDFVNSECQLVLFITDNEFVDIYAKKEEWLNIIFQNAINSNFESIQYIKSNNSYIRHKFSAYSD